MAKSISESAVNRKNLNSMKQLLAREADYLGIMQNALNLHDYLTIYKLLNPSNYNAVVGSAHATSFHAQPNLITDFKASLSHYLSKNLIDYLGQTFPFLYYDEYELGKFHIYFGDWWDRRMFGDLDVLNVSFRFNVKEYNKLRNKFLGITGAAASMRASQNLQQQQRQQQQQQQQTAQQQAAHQQAIQAHAAARARARKQNSLKYFEHKQNQRDSLKLKLKNALKENDAKTGFFNNRKRKAKHIAIVKALNKLSKEDEQAFRQEMVRKNGGNPTQSAPSAQSNSAAPTLSPQLQAKASMNGVQPNNAQPQASQPQNNNDTTSGSRSPEQTILLYECNSIRKYFGNLTQFSQKSRQIYHDYIMYLLQQAQDRKTISATDLAMAKGQDKPNKKSTKSKSSKKTTRKSTRRKRSTTKRKRSTRKSTRRRKSTTRRRRKTRKSTKRSTTRRRRTRSRKSKK